MSNTRKIYRTPADGKNYYLIDSCFLVNRFIPISNKISQDDVKRIELCKLWWDEIEKQIKGNKAKIYIPDICIAEAFKVLAKKYYIDKVFKSNQQYNYWKKKMSEFIRIPTKQLVKFDRKIFCHDISTNRDIIISVDRFFELFAKNKKNVSIADIIVAATAKYLMDFYDFSKKDLHIITLDRALLDGIDKAIDLAYAYDPTTKRHSVEKVFI